MREAGKATPPEDRAQWSEDKLIKETKKLIRMDWGGQKPAEGAVKKLVELGVPEGLAREVAPAAAKLCQRQIRGCRDRCSHNFAEMQRRLNG
jgi:hypothetical protein